MMPKINNMNIHHILTYECVPSYNGVPAQSSYNSFVDPVKNTYCYIPSLGYISI